LLNGIDEGWNNCKNLLNSPHIIERLRDLNFNSVSAATVKKINNVLSDPYFTFDRVKEASCACADLYVWIWNIAKVRSLILGILPASRVIVPTIAWPSQEKQRPSTSPSKRTSPMKIVYERPSTLYVVNDAEVIKT
jgi:hypothetical protein